MSSRNLSAWCALLLSAVGAGCGQVPTGGLSLRAARGQNVLPSFTVSAPGAVLNSATALTQDTAAGAVLIQVASTAALDNSISGKLATDDLLLIVQMQGAAIDPSASGLGAVSQLNGAGQFELATVQSFTATTITLHGCGGLANSYTAASHTQIVRVPQYSNLTINSGASVTAPAWDGTSGGIVALQISGGLDLSGAIEVTGLGFRGGTVDTNNDAVLNRTNNIYFSTDRTLGAEKGEGIAGSQSDYDLGAGRYGRGAPANGGGGGDAHNSGGGGGANADNGQTYTGAGVMPTVSTGNLAWTLDSDDIAAGGQTNSSGGGRGGYSFSTNQQDATTVRPGNRSWGGDYRRQIGGRGGHPLRAAATSAVYLGGGGGAGDANNNAGGSGGNGGGIVFAFAGNITGSGTIAASGVAGGSSTGLSNDGPGGGGGGGSIVLAASTVPSTLSLSASGGTGGLQPIPGPEAEGPGGGGGGGFISISGGLPSLAVSGGAGGTTTSSGVATFPRNGATDGAGGFTNSGALSFPFCQAADLAVTLTDGATTATPGNPITYTMVVTNSGPGTSSANISDLTPATLTNLSWSCVANASASCGSPTSGTGNIATAGASLQSGGTLTFTLNATISPSATGTLSVTGSATVSNTTQVVDPNPANNSATDLDTLVASADLSLTARGSSSATAGLGASYTLQVNNAGPSVMPGVTATYPLPAGFTYSSSTGSGAGWSCSSASGTVTCSLGTTLAVGAAPVLVINVTSSPAVSGSVVNTFTAGPATSDPNSANNSAAVPTAYSRSPDLALTASPLPTLTAGSAATYSLSLNDNGPSSATGVTLSYALPTGFSYSSASGTFWSCSQSAGVVSCALSGTLSPGLPSTLAITVSTPASGTGSVSSKFTAAVSGDPDTTNNSATVTSSYAASADLSASLTPPTSSVPAGAATSYQLAVANAGPSNAQSVSAAISFPAGFTSVSGSGAGWICAASGGPGGSTNLACALSGSLTVASAPTLTVLANAPTAAGSDTIAAQVSSTTNDPSTANNSSTATTTVTQAAADLAISLSGPVTGSAGTPLDENVTVTNAGPSAATSVTVTIPLPAGATFVGTPTSYWTCAAANGVITCVLTGALPSGGSSMVDIQILPAPDSPTDSVTASVSSDALDLNRSNNSSSPSNTAVTAQADLSIALSPSLSGAIAGAPVSFTLLAANGGPSTARSLTLTQTLPSGFTSVAASSSDGWICSVAAAGSGQTITCTLATLGAGASSSVAVTAQAPTALGSYSLGAQISSLVPDPNPGNGSATATLTVSSAVSDLMLALTGPANALATDPLHYTATVTNAGPSPASPLAISLQLPAQAALQSVGGTGWNCGTPSGGLVQCSYPSPLASGQSAPALTLTVTPPPEGGTATLRAAATSSSSNPNPADAKASVSTVVTAEADLALQLTASAASVPPSAAIRYTLAPDNAGPSTAASASITVTLPAGFSSASASGTGWTCTPKITGNGTTAFSCTAASLAPGPAPAITISATAPAAQGSYTVTASIASATQDPASANNSASLQTTVSSASADLAITLTGPATATAAGTLTYAATVSNQGPSPADGVKVVLPLPAGVTFRSGTGTGWSCAETTVGGTDRVVCSLAGTLAVGATAPALSLDLIAPAEGGRTSLAAGVGSSAADPNSLNNLGGPIVTQVKASADLGITILSSAASVAAGAGVDFTLAATNAGPSTARAVQVSFSAAGATAVTASGSGWTCSVNGAQVSCSSTLLAPGSAPAITVQVIAPASAGSIVATAMIASATKDPNLTNNSASATVVVTASADLSVTASAQSPIAAQGPLVIDCTVANAGPSDATSVGLTLSIPSGASFTSASGAGWTCTADASRVSCLFANPLAAGGTAPLSVTLVAPAVQGAASSQITVAANQPDPAPANNTELVSFTVGPPFANLADLAISIAAPAAPVYAGRSTSLLISAQNLGPDTAQSVTVTLTLPTARNLLASGSGWACTTSGVVSCTRAAFAVGGSQLVLSGSLDASATAAASISTASSDLNPDNNSATARVSVLALPEVRITATGTPASVLAGETITYLALVTNNSGSAASGLSVTQTLPAGSTWVSASGTDWTCAAAGQTVTCTSGATLPPGTSSSLTLLVSAPQTAGDAVSNFALATSTPNAALPSATQATVHTTVTEKPEADRYLVEGRGCSTGGVGSDGLCLLGLVALFAFAQRRRKGAAALALLALVVAGSAQAQSPPPPAPAPSMSTGIDLQQFKPMPGASDVLGVQSAQTLERGTFHWQVTLNGANDPLGLVDPSTGRSTRQIVDSQFGADLMAAYSLFDRLELGAALPIALQHADRLPSTSAGPGSKPSSFGLGDLRLVPKFRLNQRTHGLTFSVSMPILLPLGGGANFLGQSGPGLRPRVIAEWALRSVRFAANLGIDLRRAEDFLNVRTGTAFSYGLSAEATLGSLTLLGRPLLAQATWVGAVGLQSGSVHQVNRPSEILAALVWQLTQDLSVQAGAGPGVSRGYGTPEYRALVSISYTQVPPPSDRDHDGIADADDACPDLPGVRSTDRSKNGCPLPPPPAPDLPTPPAPDLQPELAPLVLAPPDFPPDRDHDGIPDALDACPDLPGVPSSDPQLNGCPKPTAERKVVLQGKRLVILEKVHFALAKDAILASSFPLLKQVATTLRDHPEIELIRVEGHTDNLGNARANLELSGRRARRVRNYLIDTGIAPTRVEAAGFGQDKPVSTNVTALGREANRRVEFNIVKLQEPKAVQ